VVSKMIGGDSDGTLEYEEWFKGGGITLFIQRVLLVFEVFLSVSHYLFSCIANHVTTLKQLQLLPCFDILKPNFDHLWPVCDIILYFQISPTSDPAQYTRMSPIVIYLRLNMPTSHNMV